VGLENAVAAACSGGLAGVRAALRAVARHLRKRAAFRLATLDRLDRRGRVRDCRSGKLTDFIPVLARCRLLGRYGSVVPQAVVSAASARDVTSAGSRRERMEFGRRRFLHLAACDAAVYAVCRLGETRASSAPAKS
jgi:hypothetical protein